MKHLILIGGGHSHVEVLKRFGMRPMPDVRLTLIAREVMTPYSGMLPGHIAGHYSFDECHIDLRPLCRFAGARLIHAEASGIDLAARRVLCRDRPSVPYDVASIDIGSSPSTQDVPGAAEHAIPVKPISRFVARWAALSDCSSVESITPLRPSIVCRWCVRATGCCQSLVPRRSSARRFP